MRAVDKRLAGRSAVDARAGDRLLGNTRGLLLVFAALTAVAFHQLFMRAAH